MGIVIIALRALHIVGGVFWAGGTIMLHQFVVPSVKATRPDSGRFMRHLAAQSGLTVWLSVAGIVTIVAGLALFAPASGNFDPAVMRSPRVVAISIGALIAIGAFFEGIMVSRPTSVRLGQLAAEIAEGKAPPTPEQGKQLGELERRLEAVGRRGALMLGITALLMGISRYL